MRLGDAVARLVRPERSPVLRLLQDAPVTPADILAVPPAAPVDVRAPSGPAPSRPHPSEPRERGRRTEPADGWSA